MTRIVYIDHYAGSTRHGMEFRPWYLAREWQKMGHEVTVVAATYSHLRHTNPASTGAWSREDVGGVPYVWLKTPPYQGNGLGRVKNIFWFVYRLRSAVRRLVRDCAPEVVIASSTHPFDIYPARRLARLAGARLLFELHDLWPLSPMELGNMKPWHPFIVAVQRAEDYVCRHVDHVVSLLPKAEEHLLSRGLARGRFTYAPNGVVLDEWQESGAPLLPELHAAVIEAARARDHAVVMYAGGHGLSNNLDVLLDAALEMRGEAVTFLFVGDGPEKAGLEARARSANADRVFFLPAVAKPMVPPLLSAADVLILSFAAKALYRFGISPNKLMDYMMAAKPIVAAMRAGNDPVTEHDCGISVAPGDPAAVANGIRQLVAMPAARRAVLGANGRRAVLDNYTYSAVAKRIADTFRVPA